MVRAPCPSGTATRYWVCSGSGNGPGVPLTAVEERLFTDLASQAGLVLRLVGLRAQLEDRHQELRARTQELESSRGRVIEAQDAERSRLERDIHDGAQQHLVALAMNLRLAQVVAGRSPDRARQVLAEQVDAARLAIDTLSSLSRGIYPQMLAEQGLVAALRSGVGASPIPVTVEAEDVVRPPPTAGGRPLLLLHGGGPERRQALRCDPGDRAAASHRRSLAPRRHRRRLGLRPAAALAAGRAPG